MKKTSLELSKQLKEAGYPQSRVVSHFYWAKVEGFDGYYSFLKKDLDTVKSSDPIASPTADEILDRLPCATNQEWFLISKNPNKEEWVIDWNTKNEMFKGESLADATAKCWLYLKKNNLL